MPLGGLKKFGKPSKYKYEQSVDINHTQNISIFLTNKHWCFRAAIIALFFCDISKILDEIEGNAFF